MREITWRNGSPCPTAIAGVGLAFLPFAPQIRIEPELALALFVAPALLDAAFDTSPRDLRRNAIPIASLAVIAAVLTNLNIVHTDKPFRSHHGQGARSSGCC